MSDKICAVCGDKALGYNFSALTCESCRTFFRRNANRTEEIFCYFGNKCVVNQLTRKFCKKCRIDKCFAIGMKKRLCHSKREMEMIAKYSQITGNGNTNTQVSTDSPATTAMCLHQKDGTDNSTDNQMPAYIRGLIFTFNDTERHRLKQLFYSTTWLRDPVVNLVVEPSTEPEVLRVLQIRTEMHCRRIIKMSKTITEFRELCESDKITLLKSGSQEIITLVNILSFNFEGEFWTVYTGSECASILHLGILKYGVRNLYDVHKCFMWKLNQEYNKDINIMDLLTAIVLFNHNRPNLRQKDLIKLQRQTFVYLLQRYLELKHNSKTEAEIRFTRLMNCLQDLYALNTVFVNNYMEHENMEKTELLTEILS